MKKALIIPLLLLAVPFCQAAPPKCIDHIFSARSTNNAISYNVCFLNNYKFRYTEKNVRTGRVTTTFDLNQINVSYVVQKTRKGQIETVNLFTHRGKSYALSSGHNNRGRYVAGMDITNDQGYVKHIDFDKLTVRNSASDGIGKDEVIELPERHGRR